LPNLGYGAAEALISTEFNQTAREQVKTLTTNIAKALNETIEQKKWMDDDTKRRAKDKVGLLTQLIAYPDWVTNVSTMNEYYKGSTKHCFKFLHVI
jgi:predicted metalloendopeptidase